MFNTVKPLNIPEANPIHRPARPEFTEGDMRDFAIANVVADRVKRNQLQKKLITALATFSDKLLIPKELQEITEEFLAINTPGV